MYLSIVPPDFNMISVMGVRNELISFVNPCGSDLYFSEIGVNPLMSQNRKVNSLVSPPSFNRLGSSCSFLTISGDR